MNYTFVEMSLARPSSQIINSAELVKGIYVNPVQENLDALSDKPNVVKIAKVAAWEPNQTETVAFYMTKDDVVAEGLPEWLADIVAFGKPAPSHEWANCFHILQRKTVPAISLQKVFNDNSVDRVGILTVKMKDKTADIMTDAAAFLNSKTNKPGRIQLELDDTAPEKVEQVVDTYKNMGYFVRSSDGVNVLLQHNDFPAAG